MVPSEPECSMSHRRRQSKITELTDNLRSGISIKSNTDYDNNSSLGKTSSETETDVTPKTFVTFDVRRKNIN